MARWSIRLMPDVSEFWPPLNRFRGVTRLVLRTLLIPVSITAMAGYVGCVVIFATAFLYLPLQFMQSRPGAGWLIWAGFVLLVYCAVMASILVDVIRHARQRIIDVPGVLHALLFVAGLLLAAWFIPIVIKEKPASPAEPAKAVAAISDASNGGVSSRTLGGPASPRAVGAVDVKRE